MPIPGRELAASGSPEQSRMPQDASGGGTSWASIRLGTAQGGSILGVLGQDWTDDDAQTKARSSSSGLMVWDVEGLICH